MTNFEKWDKAFQAQKLSLFNGNDNAILWLKVRAICRGKQLKQFLANNKIKLGSTKLSEQNVELFNLLESKNDASTMLDTFLTTRIHEWYKSFNIDEKQLKEDLYRVSNYVWGGNQNNSLDKYLVSQYVKKISDYGALLKKQSEIACNAWNYVQTSWYNNWTSYLIESLFKRHQNVISATGEIKSVDFFINNIPIDLKVTFFPEGYMNLMLKKKLKCSEISWLKKEAKKHKITFDNTLDDSSLRTTLLEKFEAHNLKKVLRTINTARKKVIKTAQNKPDNLLKWLYANQGEMRFGSENRIFLILVDINDMSQSWKMKRAISIIEPQVNSYLNSFTDDSLHHIHFSFRRKRYQTLADTIFVIKD